MEYQDFIKKLQTEMNAKGERLTVDGDAGPKTRAALARFDVDLVLKPIEKHSSVIHIGEDFGAPWVFANIDLLGLHETDPRLNERYVPEWKLEGLPGYKTLSGNTYAWCSVRANADRRKVGVQGTNSAAASSWSTWGKKCPFWFGAALDIKHKSGGRHICDFLYWYDFSKRIAATLDGNKGNKFCVALTDLSGSGDVLVTGPRWSRSVADGREVSMQEVLALYPFLKPGSSTGGTTR